MIYLAKGSFPPSATPIAVKPQLQTGSALIVSLVMLLLMTLVGLAGMQTTIMQEKMSANLHDRELALQAAETALRDAENTIMNTPPTGFNNASGLYEMNSDDRPDWGGGTQTSASTIAYSGVLDGLASQPDYFVEDIASLQPAGTSLEVGVAIPPVAFYRITARGIGGSPDAVVVLKSVFRSR
jgi:type IV pilus assembly protein PilX